MNPCPCGYSSHPNKKCSCSSHAINRYLSKISGPLLDRIDMHVQVSPIPYLELRSDALNESSRNIKKRVLNARRIQEIRYLSNDKGSWNAQMSNPQIKSFCALESEANELLALAMTKLNLSARAYSRILKVSRTIADLDESEKIATSHIAEAIHYRCLDRDGK